MNAPTLTHAEFAAKLVVDGCVPIVEGKTPGKMPIEGMPLDDAAKAAADAHPGSLAVFYPVGDSGVFMQMHGSNARVWYKGVSTDGALETLEKAIQRAYPQAVFRSQVEHTLPGMSVRLYRIEFGGKHFADIEASYPTTLDVPQQFVVRVHARERTAQ